MSSLIYITEETQVLIAMDTLATSAGEPVLFTTKAFPVPHLRMVIAGTGSAGFLDSWLLLINTRTCCRGIDDLNRYATSLLPELWAWQKDQATMLSPTTTVYHFGFCENTKLIHAFAYRSETGFRSDPIGYGLGGKPECTLTDLAVQQVMDDPLLIRRMMDEQRIIQMARPKEERLYIGGEIQFHYLTSTGYSVFTVDRFDDLEEHEKAIYKG